MSIAIGILTDDGWRYPQVLAGAALTCTINSASRLEFTMYNDKQFSFYEGDLCGLFINGEQIFSGVIFTKSRQDMDFISVLAYDSLRYLQNSDCCSFVNVTASEIVNQVALLNGLAVGDLVDTVYKIPVKIEDKSTYIDMVTDALADTLVAVGKRYVLFDDLGKLRVCACENLGTDVVLRYGNVHSMDYETSIDDDVYNKVKLVYERYNKGETVVAQNDERISDWGVLQYYSKSASVSYTQSEAEELLASMVSLGRTLSISGAFGDLSLRGGSMVLVDMDLGDIVAYEYLIVKSVRHYFKNGQCLMDLVLFGDRFDA